MESVKTLIALYHPRSNGEVKRFAQTFKNAIKRGKQVGVGHNPITIVYDCSYRPSQTSQV